MQSLNRTLDTARSAVRSVMREVAKAVNSLSGGRLSPNMVTIIGMLAHFYIAYLITQRFFTTAAVLLIIFGLFDALDGELARLQKRVSNAGMLLDATTDRVKEVILYSSVAYVLIISPQPRNAVWAVIACGTSLLVSYIKAKGETAVKDAKLSPNEINRLFQDGLMRFEIRMVFLIVGLLLDRLLVAVVLIAVLSSLTAFSRLARISRALNES